MQKKHVLRNKSCCVKENIDGIRFVHIIVASIIHTGFVNEKDKYRTQKKSLKKIRNKMC